MSESRKRQIMEHLGASTSSKIEVPAIAQGSGGYIPQPLYDDRDYSRCMEHVALSLGNFYKQERSSAEIIEHLNLTTSR